MIGPEKPDTVLLPGPTVSDIALNATRSVGRAVGKGIESLDEATKVSPQTIGMDESYMESKGQPIDVRGAIGQGVDAVGRGFAAIMDRVTSADTPDVTIGDLAGVSESQSSFLERREQRKRAEKVIEESNKQAEEAQKILDQRAKEAEKAEAESKKDKGQGTPPPPPGPSSKEREISKKSIDLWKQMTGDEDDTNFWNAVMMAGLGIASGQSDDALTNVAQGALLGLQEYNKGRSLDKKTKLAQSIELAKLELLEDRAESERMTAEATAELRTAQAQALERGESDKITDKQRTRQGLLKMGFTPGEVSEIEVAGPQGINILRDIRRKKATDQVAENLADGIEVAFDEPFPGPAGGVFVRKKRGNKITVEEFTG